ncbi:MAG: oxygen-dependent coproporphyrinogen oxidase [Bacteroidota bacterium]
MAATRIRPESIKVEFTQFVQDLQDEICAELEAIDGQAQFIEDKWQRPGGGGGKTRVMADGKVFEKGGVNTSIVHGELPEPIKKQFGVAEAWFYATGISLVIHPENPHVPTTHANYRYFELYDKAEGEPVDAWVGGGADLTPYYLYEEDAVHFHAQQKAACDAHDPALYPDFKQRCDDYFYNAHRKEGRGIGGIFYDYCRATADRDMHWWLAFSQSAGNAFLKSFAPIVRKRKDTLFTPEQRDWQEHRRGRYVEFNLVYDRGTVFGLQTNGRTESILMSMPPLARWEYGYEPEPNSPEAELTTTFLKPQDWVNWSQ